ncbi:MAG TPA: phosphate ABC transporter substrate-binding protein PstS [Limnochordales bacterium]
MRAKDGMARPRLPHLAATLAVTMALLLGGALGGPHHPVAARAVETLTGAGATFPYPLYSRYFDVYHRLTGVRVNYQSIGSGGGQRQLRERTVNFGASDAFLTDEQLAQYPGPVLHIPTALGAVVVTYNLRGIDRPLRFTGELLADIYLGEVVRWNDPRIQQLNPDVTLPPLPVVVVHRSDGSGTTFVWTDYLAKVSPRWRQRVGVGTSVAWPTGLGGKGNEGVAGLVRQIPGAIGYIEMVYARSESMSYGMVRNRAGRWVLPTLESVSAAAAVEMPPDTRVSLTDTAAPDGYPIAGLTWLLVYQDLSLSTQSVGQARALAQLLWWIVHEGQRYNESLHYARLPEPVVRRAEALLTSLHFRGEPLLAGAGAGADQPGPSAGEGAS